MLLLKPNKAEWALVPERKCQTDLLLLTAAPFIVFNVSLPMSCLGEFFKTSCISYSVMQNHPRLDLL